MKKNLTVLTLILFSSVSLKALDFDNAALPGSFSRLLSSVPAPEAKTSPSPGSAMKTCRPFLVSLSVGGVEETISFSRVCTSENDAIWKMSVSRKNSAVIKAEASSGDDPQTAKQVGNKIKSMVLNGMSPEDADFVVMKIGPLLRDAEKADSQAGRDEMLGRAGKMLAEYLSRP